MFESFICRLHNSSFKSSGTVLGDPKKDIFLRGLDDDGRPCLHKVGEKDVNEEIQSFKEETEYSKMFERMEAGDPIAEQKASFSLNSNSDLEFGDFSQKSDLRTLAHSIFEAHQVYKDAGGQSSLGISFEDFLRNSEIKTGLKSDLGPKLDPEVKPDEQK